MESRWDTATDQSHHKCASVVFRWCRTVATKGNTVIILHLQPDPPVSLYEVTLCWNPTWRHYESSRVVVPCGHFCGSRLVIDNTEYTCEPFAITPSSFEVNLFLEEETEVSWPGMSEINPHKRTFSWSGSPESDVRPLSRMSQQFNKSSYGVQIEILYRLLSSRDEEIAQLKLEVAQLRTVIENTSRGRDPDRCDVVAEDDEFNFRGEIQMLRQELEATCSKNEELSKELRELREENVTLRRGQIKDALNNEDASPRLDSVFSSISDTQGKQSRERNYTVSESVKSLTSEDEEEFLSSLFGRTMSGVQTNITALFGNPSFYEESEKLKGLRKADKLNSNRSQKSTKRDNYSRVESGSDTDELLEEAQSYLNGHLKEHVQISSVTNWTQKSRPKSQIKLPFLPKSMRDVKPGLIVKYLGYGGRMSQGKVLSVDTNGEFVAIQTPFTSEISKIHSAIGETRVPFKKIVLAWDS